MNRRLLFSAAFALLVPLAACGDDDNGTGPARLTTEQVGANYNVCALTFTPDGGEPAPVNLLNGVVTNSAQLQVLASSREFALSYRPADGLAQVAPGTYQLGNSNIDLRFNSSNAATGLLLPTGRDIRLDFQPSPKQLSTSATTTTAYSISKADYERVTGTTRPNLANQIQGQLTASFRVASCS
jgi:hypothetical protein